MNRPNLSTTGLLALLLAFAIADRPSYAADDGDFQFWTAAGASLDLNKDWAVNLEEEFRFGDDAGRLYYQHSDLGFVYGGLADWLDLGINYRQVFETDSSGKWRQENRPHFNFTVKGEILDLALSNRSRFEYRDRENKDDVWRYRNKFTVKFPVKLTSLQLQPYIADEIFVDFKGDHINRNRLYSGFSFALAENLKGGLYYLWQASKSGHQWNDANVLGLQLKLRF